MKFVALLRGINVGGNNKVPMPELKTCFENIGFTDVLTYINSGNVLFKSTETNKLTLVQMAEAAIEKQFGLRVVCSVVSADELVAAVDHAPKWWGIDNGAKHSVLFVIAPKTAKEIMAEVGKEKPEYEKVEAYEPVIFWSAPLDTFSRTRYSKIVGTAAYQSVTIRNANTTKKLAQLCSDVK